MTEIFPAELQVDRRVQDNFQDDDDDNRTQSGHGGGKSGHGPTQQPRAAQVCEYSSSAESEESQRNSKKREMIKEHRSEEHTSELQSLTNLVCRLLLEKK